MTDSVTVVSPPPRLVTVETQPKQVVTVKVPGQRGRQGERGPGIFVSATPPEGAILGDIWIKL